MIFNPNSEQKDMRQIVPVRWEKKDNRPENGKCLGNPKTKRWPVSLEHRKRGIVGVKLFLLLIFSMILCWCVQLWFKKILVRQITFLDREDKMWSRNMLISLVTKLLPLLDTGTGDSVWFTQYSISSTWLIAGIQLLLIKSGESSLRCMFSFCIIILGSHNAFPLEECMEMHSKYSCLENPMEREAWEATVHRVAKSWTWLKWLSTHAYYLSSIKELLGGFFLCQILCWVLEIKRWESIL